MKAPREVEVTFGKDVRGLISVPHSKDSNQPYKEGYAPSTHRGVILLHGQGGHRDYCYQKQLAHRLASDLGVYSLRIDFRGCGYSGENADPESGRTLDQDVEDIQEAVEFMSDKGKNPLEIPFAISAIIGHSRGSVAMFLWALEQDKLWRAGDPRAIVVPNLINCSARFTSITVADRYPIFDESFEYLEQTCFRHGKFQKTKIPKTELKSLAYPDLTKLRHLSTEWSVLSIYGLKDSIIPITDCAKYANTLNRGEGTHQLELIEKSDHNFYGVKPVTDEWEMEELNPKGLPLTSKKLVNYNHQVVEIILDYLRNYQELRRFTMHSSSVDKIPRWKEIEGVSNFRDMGGWRITSPTFGSSYPHPLIVKPGIIYRCANMARLTDNGANSLRDLKIKTIFDFRSEGECKREPCILDFDKYGIKRIHIPVYAHDDYSPQEIAMRYANLMTCWSTYVHVYEDMLAHGKGAFKRVFEYIRDDGRPFVFHCTAGKDRTGIMGMLILLLMGVDKNTIAKEYELTAIGLRPDFPRLQESFIQTVNKLKAKLGDTSDLDSLIAKGRENWSVEVDGFQNLISSRYEAMLSTVNLLNDKYNGIKSYMLNELGFNENDLIKIYHNLVYHKNDYGFILDSGNPSEQKYDAKM